MKKNIINIFGILALLITLAIMGFGVWYFFSGSSSAIGRGFAGGYGNFSESGTEEIQETVRELDVSSVFGDITIIAWPESHVKIDYTKKAASHTALNSLRISAETHGDKLRIRTERPRRYSSVGDAAFTIYLPASVTAVWAQSVSGSLRLEEQESQKGRLALVSQHLETVSSNISTAGSADLDIKSVSGSLFFISQGDSIKAETTSGRQNGEISAFSDDQKILLETVSGSLKLRLVSGWSGIVEMNSISGSMRCNQPLLLQEQNRKSLKGRLGDGGAARIRLESISGSLTIE